MDPRGVMGSPGPEEEAGVACGPLCVTSVIKATGAPRGGPCTWGQ